MVIITLMSIVFAIVISVYSCLSVMHFIIQFYSSLGFGYYILQFISSVLLLLVLFFHYNSQYYLSCCYVLVVVISLQQMRYSQLEVFFRSVTKLLHCFYLFCFCYFRKTYNFTITDNIFLLIS